MSAPSYPCQRCGGLLRWVPQYNQWYCDRCQAYASGYQRDGFDEIVDSFRTPAYDSTPRCNMCGYYIRWVAEYGRWWCDRCQRYL